LDHVLDDRNAFRGVALEQMLISMAAQHEVKLPYQIPDVMQSSIHTLSTKRTVYVGGVASDKESPHAQLSDMAVMDTKISAPIQGERFHSSGCAFRQDLAHDLKRRSFSFHFLSGRDNPAASRTHRKNCHRSQLTGTQLQLVGGKGFVAFNVS